MRRASVIQLASLLTAATILFVGSSFPASAAKKCITIGGKTVCLDDGKGNKGKNGDAPGKDGNGKNDNGGNANGGNGGAPQGGDDQPKGGNDNGAAGGDDDQPKGGNDNGDDQNGGAPAPQEGDDQPEAEPRTLDCSKAQCDPGYIKLDKPNAYKACCQAIDRCPPERPSGTPPNCCEAGLTFREGFCRVSECPPGTTGVPPHCERVCGPGKIKVGQTCYDPCPAGTLGTPPNCKCPDWHDWDDGAKTCVARKCTGGMVGTQPNCSCPSGSVLKSRKCEACVGGKVPVKGECKCPKGTGVSYDGKCKKCEGGRVTIDNLCQCPEGMMVWPNSTSNCVKGTREVCVWRGTAPACDGSCKAGEEYRGGAHSSDSWSGGGAVPGGFGSSCWSGSKHYCCRPAP
jgi:hypothetical protein